MGGKVLGGSYFPKQRGFALDPSTDAMTAQGGQVRSGTLIDSDLVVSAFYVVAAPSMKETNPLRPLSPYAVSKVGEDMLAFMYWQAYKIRTIRTRMFTHSGARRGEVFVDSFFALQIARIEAGLQEPVVRVGNLDSVRTFADVRDTVRAYWLLAQKCPPGEVYNIGGEITMTIREMLDLLLGMTTFKGKIEVRQDPALIRPADVTLQIPSSEKFKAATGWKPEIPYRQTLLDMLNYWRQEIARDLPQRH